MCDLCDGTQIIHVVLMPGVVKAEPCPNCNKALRKQRYAELKRVLKEGAAIEN